MIIEKLKTWQGHAIDLVVESASTEVLDGSHLIAMPALIDPHVHFRTPGMEYKEDWYHGAKAALRGGCTQVFDMPNTIPPTVTAELLAEKKALIDHQLAEVGIPLRYELFFGADKHHLDQIPKVAKTVVGIKVFMGCSTGNLVIDDDASLHAVFELAAQQDLLVAVHAEDEHLIRERKAKFAQPLEHADHSKIRNVDVATRAVEKAIQLTKRYGTRLYILHMSTSDEIELVRQAKKAKLPVFAETTPHHLFFDTRAYADLGGRAVVNPPLRDASHHEALWRAIHDQVIDTMGSDHAPHTIAEKNQAYGQCPSGMPGIEFMLPLLLNAYHEGKLSLNDIVSLTSARAKSIFRLSDYQDWVIVDLNRSATVLRTESKCGWSPYQGLTLKGWPVYTILQGRCYTLGAC